MDCLKNKELAKRLISPGFNMHIHQQDISSSMEKNKMIARSLLDRLRHVFIVFVFMGLLMGCKPSEPPLPKELILYNWSDYMPESVLESFKKEYGVKVTVHTYEGQDEAYANITKGTESFDLAVIENDLLPSLIVKNLLAEMDFGRIPNFSNISANFRELRYDPGNHYSVPYNWGTSGLIVRSDLIDTPVTAWADLWDPRYAGKIALHTDSTEIISIALLSLGYPLNTEDPAQLEAALKHLMKIKESVTFIPSDPQSTVDILKSGRVAIVQGWNGDALLARDQDPSIKYVLPEEGTMLWGDSFVISANSKNQYAAEVFLNFLLRPEVSAQIVKTYFYPSANETVGKFLEPEILNDPLIYPPRDYLTANSFYAPLSEKGQKLYNDIWKRFLEGNP